MNVLKSIVWVVACVVVTFAVHEASHAVSSWLLGYDTFARVNSSGLISGEYRTAYDENLTSLVGPLITICQALLGLALALALGWRPAFVIVLAALLMRVLAAAASLRLPNDEARLGLAWGVGYWTLHAAVIALLLGAAIWAATRLKITAIAAGWRVLLICVAMVAVVAAEPILPTLELSAHR